MLIHNQEMQHVVCAVVCLPCLLLPECCVHLLAKLLKRHPVGYHAHPDVHSCLLICMCICVCACMAAVFDPRFPHGVRPVAGTKDPQKGRLVLHGEPGSKHSMHLC